MYFTRLYTYLYELLHSWNKLYLSSGKICRQSMNSLLFVVSFRGYWPCHCNWVSVHDQAVTIHDLRAFLFYQSFSNFQIVVYALTGLEGTCFNMTDTVTDCANVSKGSFIAVKARVL